VRKLGPHVIVASIQIIITIDQATCMHRAHRGGQLFLLLKYLKADASSFDGALSYPCTMAHLVSLLTFYATSWVKLAPKARGESISMINRTVWVAYRHSSQ
jgi:hypothetical protein